MNNMESINALMIEQGLPQKESFLQIKSKNQ
jgi:hypothetical protein